MLILFWCLFLLLSSQPLCMAWIYSNIFWLYYVMCMVKVWFCVLNVWNVVGIIVMYIHFVCIPYLALYGQAEFSFLFMCLEAWIGSSWIRSSAITLLFFLTLNFIQAIRKHYITKFLATVVSWYKPCAVNKHVTWISPWI